MRKNIFLIAIILCSIFACNEEDFKTYHGGNFISFLSDYKTDSVITSFFYYYNASEINLPIVVQLSATPLKEDKKFKISVLEEETNAPASNYKIEPEYVFHKNKILDTIRIQLIKTEDNILQTKAFRLVLQIEENESFKPGQSQLCRKKIIFSDLIAQPEWWDDIVTEAYLGIYSDLKYQEFLKATDGEAAYFGEMNSLERRKLALKFKYYLIENPVWDGYVQITVPIN